MEKFKGVIPALLTPYTKSGDVNAQSIAKLVDLNNKKGVDGFYVGGSTGEGMILSCEERKQVFKYVAKANDKKATLIAHVGTTSTKDAIDMAKYAESLEYDAISAVAPYYYSYSYEVIKNYYLEIADSTSLPMIIYNFPNAHGFSFNKAHAEDMLKDPKFIGIKHTSVDLFMLEQFKTIDKDKVIYNGYDEMFIAGLTMGADGGIGSTFNFMAEKYIEMYNLFNQGNIIKATEIQKECNKIITVLIKYGVFVSEKAILEEFGIEMNGCRKPFLPISDEGKKAIKQLVKQLI